MKPQLEDTYQLANLALLNLTEATAQTCLNDLNQLSQFAASISNLDTQGILPLIQPIEVEYELRADVPTYSNQRDELQKLAPAVEAGLYLVPRVVE